MSNVNEKLRWEYHTCYGWVVRDSVCCCHYRQRKNGNTRWSRQFTDDVFIKPLATGSFQIEVVGADGANLDWNITKINGENQEH